MSLRKIIITAMLVVSCFGLTANAKPAIKSIVVFGDSLSDIGNTTHLLKSLRKDEDPAYLVYPFKVFVLDKMDEYADVYHVPQMILDAGKSLVGDFFDNELATFLSSVVLKINMVPVVPSDPYFGDHFSNGHVWNEHLADKLHLDMTRGSEYTNQAFGGSWAATYDYQLSVWNVIRHPINTLKNLIKGKLMPPSLGLVSTAYLMVNKQLNPDTVYFVMSGGNDYLNVLGFEDNYNPAVMTEYVDNVLSAIESTSMRLVKAGAKHMVVFGMPNVGVAPRYVFSSDEPVLTQATLWHNNRLKDKVKQWQQDNEDVKFTYIDLQGMLEDAREHPANYGLTNVTDACIDVKLPTIKLTNFAGGEHPFERNSVLQYAQQLQYKDPSFGPNEKNYHVCGNPDEYLFWDEVHPTAAVHKVLADKVCKNLQAGGYEVKC